jgi:molybdopterin synthase sulfur carrier subunit
MVDVWVPALLRDLTGGQEKVTVAGATVGEVIDALERLYPGIRARLCEEGKLRANLVVVVDGLVRTRSLRQRLSPASEVIFLAAMSGGSIRLPRGSAPSRPGC